MLITALAVIGGYTVAGTVWSIITYLFHDREGNSGRFKHWEKDDE